MPKLPIISGKQAVTVFKKMNYRVVRQKGSHIRMRHGLDANKRPLTVPDHKVLGKGLLRKLLRDAELTVDDFIKFL